MEKSSLSEHERRVLARLERLLRQDEAIDLGMRRLAAGRRHVLRGIGSGRSLGLLCLLSLSLMITGMATSQTLVTVAFAAVWAVTLLLAATWLFASSGRRSL